MSYEADLMDELSASVFSGDMLFDDEKRKELKDHAEAWLREITRREISMLLE